ncbi:hypothetical protein D3C71_813660 [compost metagenome]
MNIFIMALEPLETRYTGQWFNGIPKLLKEAAESAHKQVTIHNVAGEQTETKVTEGAFLNFTATNIWKNTQINKLANWFADGTVRPGDKILFTDAWHTGVIQAKYMSELTDIPVEIHSMWHAGSYDPQDFLGRKILDKRWTYSVERSYFFASDFNYFATEFHKELFLEKLFQARVPTDGLFLQPEDSKFVISGQPHNELVEKLQPFRNLEKRDLVLFPHRVAPEKQPEIFRDLAASMPDVEFIICQEQNYTKDEYHRILGEAKVVFSANLQETLGISAMEGVLVDTVPMVPDRLSYSEMYLDTYKYPSVWTESWESYQQHKNQVIAWLRDAMLDTGMSQGMIPMQRFMLMEKYLSAGPMVDKLLG